MEADIRRSAQAHHDGARSARRLTKSVRRHRRPGTAQGWTCALRAAACLASRFFGHQRPYWYWYLMRRGQKPLAPPPGRPKKARGDPQ